MSTATASPAHAVLAPSRSLGSIFDRPPQRALAARPCVRSQRLPQQQHLGYSRQHARADRRQRQLARCVRCEASRKDSDREVWEPEVIDNSQASTKKTEGAGPGEEFDVMNVLAEVKRDKGLKLVVSLAIDFLGMASYGIPVVGEAEDIAWAPICAFILNYLYGMGEYPVRTPSRTRLRSATRGSSGSDVWAGMR
eukprot:scaffold4387_cov400-Prasinococcus_capsulatus_cf.AAC.3